MCLNVDIELLAQAGLSERDALIEFACALNQAGRLSLPLAARFAGISRPAFEHELRKRGLPVYVITSQDFEEDLRTLGAMGAAD
jgi:predicted HTH domain antitoxin